MRTVIILSLALVMLSLVACAPTGVGPTVESRPQTGTVTVETSMPMDEEEAPAKRGGTLALSVGPDIDVFDPALATGFEKVGTINLVAETLLYQDAETGDLMPGLVESWEPLEDGAIWRLHLREGVEFHDGTPFDAEAVKFNLDRVLDPATKAPWRGRLSAVTDVRVVDPLTVDIELTGPFAPFVRLLTEPGLGINSPTQLKKLGEDYQMHPMGTGPFKFVEHIKGQHARMAANESYWGGRPSLDEVIIKPIPDDAARVVALEAGDVDIIYNVPAQDMGRVQDNPNLELLTAPGSRAIEVNINHSKPPFDDIRVRKALKYAIDKEALNGTVFSGLAEVSTSMFTKRAFGHCPQEPYGYDVAKAKQLLEEAGYPDGFETTLSWGSGLYLSDSQVAEVIQAMLAEVGIRVTLQPIEAGAFLADFYKPATENPYDLTISGISNGILDAWKGLQHYHGTKSGFIKDSTDNQMFYNNPQLDELLDQGETTADPEARKTIYCEAQKIVWEDAVTVPLYIQPVINAKAKMVKDVFVRPNVTIELRSTWIEE